MASDHPVELPRLPRPSPSVLPLSLFTRKRLKVLLHQITGELKHRGTKTPHIFLPFRSRVNDGKLDEFLTRLFPDGDIIDEAKLPSVLHRTDEFTLICGLKYLWCRLPNSEVIGWDVYLEYKRKEKEAGYPKDAFLTIMPKCLSSPAHASIVYDFLDLLIGIASNSQYNYLSGRKIAKMSSLWAFNSSAVAPPNSAFYDATINREFNFIQGLDAWKATSDALFHLLLSFLRAMLPDNDMDTLKLPKTLQSLLITNSYPPLMTDSMKSMITIPCVLIKSTKVSSNPYELISKVRHTLSFEKKNSFLSIENYTILKNIFQKGSTSEIISTLTEESRRVLTRITNDPVDSDFDLCPGWTKNVPETDPNIPLYSQITIHDVTLQDYYIWTWLSTLGSDQTSGMKGLFGRSLVVEAGLKGFQKWLIITEETMPSDEYLSIFKSTKTKSKQSSQASLAPKRESSKRVNKNYIRTKEMPPLPPGVTKGMSKPGLLGELDFEKSTSRLVDDNSYDFLSENEDISSDYKTYLQSLSDFNEDDITSSIDKSYYSQPSPVPPTTRSRPPSSPLSEPRNPSALSLDSKGSSDKEDVRLSQPKRRPIKSITKSPERRHSPERRRRSPERRRRPSPDWDEDEDRSSSPYKEPFDNYNTPNARDPSRRLVSDPFEHYMVQDQPRMREDTSRPIQSVEEIQVLMEKDVEEKRQQDRRQRQSPNRRRPPTNMALDIQIEEEIQKETKQLRRPQPGGHDFLPPDNNHIPHNQAFPTYEKQKRREPTDLGVHELLNQPQNRNSFIDMVPSDRRHQIDQRCQDDLPPLPETSDRPPTPPEKPYDELRQESKRPTNVRYVEKIPAPQFSPPRQPSPQKQGKSSKEATPVPQQPPQTKPTQPQPQNIHQPSGVAPHLANQGYRHVTPITGKPSSVPKPIRAPQPKKPQAFAAMPKPGTTGSSHPYGTPPKGQQFSYGFNNSPQYYYGQQQGYPPQMMGHMQQQMYMPQQGMPRGYMSYGYMPQGQRGYYLPGTQQQMAQYAQANAQVPQHQHQVQAQAQVQAHAQAQAQAQAQHQYQPQPQFADQRPTGVPSPNTMMQQIPQSEKYDKNKTTNMAQMRAALNQMG